jgi:hypothetical protein
MMDQFIDALFKQAPFKLIEFLYRRLNKVLILENRSDKPNEYYDYSYIWRKSIGESRDDYGVDDLRDILINRFRNYALIYIDDDKDKLTYVLNLLQRSKFPLMKRIQLYLISQKPHLDDKLLHNTINDFSLIDDDNTHNEYYKLFENTFATLPESIQTAYLKWVMNGPDKEKIKQSRTSEDGESPSEKLIDSIVGHWQLRMFAPITKFLTKPYKELYESLCSKFGKPEHPEFVSYTTSWTGPTSPLSSADIAKMSIEGIISYLKEWTPEVSHFAPSPEGLGRFLSDDVKTRPNDYLAKESLFSPTEIRPVYFYHLFMGLRQAVKDNSTFDWNNAIKLSEAIVFATDLPVPKAIGDDWETTWSGVNKEIAGFISEALQHIDFVPYQFRFRIWKLIEKLIQETDPTTEYEAKYGGDNMSPVDMSINTGRGEAAHALFRYAFWCNHNENKDIDEKQQKHAIPPEALAVVNDLLNTIKEPTLTIRSIIGWYLQYLAFLDLKWTQNKLQRIIPEEPQFLELKKAAFEGYFSFNQPNGYIYRNLRGFFESAYEWAIEIDNTSTMHRPRYHYLGHLMTFYWWGLEPFDKQGSLVNRLFTSGQPAVKAKAWEFIGRSLEGLLPRIPGGPEVLKRICDLYDWRIAGINTSKINIEDIQKELQPFGWWFANAHIDKGWLISRLNDTLILTGGVIDWTNGVMDRLPDYIHDYPLEVARAVDSIVRGGKNIWDIEIWKDRIFSIFESLKASENKRAWETCRGTIDYLGETGHSDFGKLL